MLILFPLLLLASEPVAAAPAQPGKQSDPNGIICEKLPAPTGSRLGERKVCKSRADWEQERFDAKQALEINQTRRSTKG
jgi:hypothetical protein